MSADNEVRRRLKAAVSNAAVSATAIFEPAAASARFSRTELMTIIGLILCVSGGLGVVTHHGRCANGGRIDSGKCVCATGWEGSRCLSRVNPCVTQPCRNEGTCVVVGNDTYRCDCLPGWKGDTCEIDVRGCLEKRCVNGGKCWNLPLGEAYCICPFGTLGANCEKVVDLCSPLNPPLCAEGLYCVTKPGGVGFDCLDPSTDRSSPPTVV